MGNGPDYFPDKINAYVPSERVYTTLDSRIGDGLFFVGKVLDKACLASEENRKYVEQLYESKKSREMSEMLDKVSDSPVDR